MSKETSCVQRVRTAWGKLPFANREETTKPHGKKNLQLRQRRLFRFLSCKDRVAHPPGPATPPTAVRNSPLSPHPTHSAFSMPLFRGPKRPLQTPGVRQMASRSPARWPNCSGPRVKRCPFLCPPCQPPHPSPTPIFQRLTPTMLLAPSPWRATGRTGFRGQNFLLQQAPGVARPVTRPSNGQHGSKIDTCIGCNGNSRLKNGRKRVAPSQWWMYTHAHVVAHQVARRCASMLHTIACPKASFVIKHGKNNIYTRTLVWFLHQVLIKEHVELGKCDGIKAIIYARLNV